MARMGRKPVFAPLPAGMSSERSFHSPATMHAGKANAINAPPTNKRNNPIPALWNNEIPCENCSKDEHCDVANAAVRDC